MTEHHFEKSVAYTTGKACPSGYHKRRGYTIKKSGTYVPPRCIRATTIYAESSKQFKNRTLKRRSDALAHYGKVRKPTKKCPSGQIARAAYVRRFTSGIKQRGFTVKRKSGKTYRVYPKKTHTVVRSACIKDRGLPGKAEPGKQIGPLRKGELKKYGYVYRFPTAQRHLALQKAVGEFGALGVYRKLNAVAKLSIRTAPDASEVFQADRNWVQAQYGPLKAKAF
jgi:hypothetical protein